MATTTPSSRLSLDKVAGSAGTVDGTEPCPVSDASQSQPQPHKKSHKLKFRVKSSSNTDISNHYSMVKEGDAESVEINASKAESLLVVDSHASVDQIQPITSVKKDKKKRRLSLTLPREDIEEDIAAYEASSGGKRLRRRRKRDQPRSNADQRRLDRLFPDFD
ncbi:hypothetical protein GQ457_02G027750 [Hibiscus cannabinus]